MHEGYKLLMNELVEIPFLSRRPAPARDQIRTTVHQKILKKINKLIITQLCFIRRSLGLPCELFISLSFVSQLDRNIM